MGILNRVVFTFSAIFPFLRVSLSFRPAIWVLLRWERLLLTRIRGLKLQRIEPYALFTELLYRSFMYSLVSLLSGIYPFSVCSFALLLYVHTFLISYFAMPFFLSTCYGLKVTILPSKYQFQMSDPLIFQLRAWIHGGIATMRHMHI